MSAGRRNRERKFMIWGWGLFVLCAGFFIAYSVEAHNILNLVGSIIFLIACVVFLIPLVMNGREDGEDD